MPASVTTIASFPTSGGTDPDGQLFIDSSGDLIGATVHGGANSIGTTYEIAKIGGGYATTPTFLADIPTGLNTLLGVANLSADANGDLFGLDITGGANSLGAIVEFPKAGGTTTLPTTFAASSSHPGGRLLVDASGNLFGTTVSGGANGAGTVFEIEKIGAVYAATPTTLTSFGSGITPSGSGNLIEDAAGDLFGTTTSSVFEVKKTGSSYGAPTSLISIPFPVGTQIGTLTIDAKGDIFGTTISGGANDAGSVFEIEKTATGYVSAAAILASFTLADGQLSLNHPKTLIVDANGDLFGTTDPSSENSGGVVYEIVRTSTGYESTPTIVQDFNGGADGVGLGANVVADASGDLFTTTKTGGNGSGSVLEITGSGFATTPTITPIISSIVWQNTDGQAALWQMDGTSKIASALVNPNPGPGWRVVGSGDFSGNGNSDILWQNASGQAAIWEMDGTTKIAGALIAGNPGPSWTEVGTGDFNGDGNSDILWQNTDGQVAIWEMDGTNKIGSAVVAGNPGPSWKAVGTGDFNGDGNSDILWQNTDGQVAIWEMDGTNKIGSAVVTGNPGPSWKAVGTGDFNGDGNSDILWQNTDGQVAIWNMDGTNKIGSALIADNPGPSWTAIGAGGGGSDILLQNTSGQITLWEMHENAIAGGGLINPNPGSTWHAIGLT
jgi:uncharacterized repeat protein (TIGR03803 family)